MNELDTEAFGERFEGMTVTLMDGRSLRRELALLRAVLRPSDTGWRQRRPPYADEVWGWAISLSESLPASLPANPAALRESLALRRWRGTAPEWSVVRDAYNLIRSAEPHARLFLVPAQWNLRMEQILSGLLYPAQVRTWALQRWRRP